MRLKHPDLLLASAIALANVVWALLPARVPAIGVALALPLVFVLPGYTLTGVLFHSRFLDAVHRMLLSLGVSVAMDIAAGLALNVFPVGLRPASWSALLALLTAVLAALGAYLRRGTAMPKSPQRATGMGEPPGRRSPGSSPALAWVLFGLAAVVVVLSLGFSASSVAQQPRAGFTQFWMLPSDQPAESCAVNLGIQSYELTSETYRVDMTVNGTQITTWPLVELAPRQAWESFMPLVSSEAGSVSIEAQLYRVDNPRVVYRSVNITLYVARGKHECQATAI